MKTRLRPLSLLVILIAGAAMCLLTERTAAERNGSLGFPLDDPWIHLQFAKNLHDYGAFSYFKNLQVTSGSTSPLYTAMLAAGFFLTSNEMVLSYVLGGVFLLVAAFFVFKLVLRDFSDNVLIAVAAAFLILFEPRLQWIALSGMETTLFIAILIASMYFYREKRPVFLGLALGLLLWTRPEALLFVFAMAVDALYHAARESRHASTTGGSVTAGLRWLSPAIIMFILFGLAYFGFNEWLSGSMFPNTFSSKIKTYSQWPTTDFSLQVYHFLIDGHFSVLGCFAAIGSISILVNIIRRRNEPALLAFLWALGMFLAYWKSLPYLYHQGRYLMPILPFYILIGLRGIQATIIVGSRFIRIMGKPAVVAITSALILLVVGVQFALATWNGRGTYANDCEYVSERQVRAGKWMREHLPEDAVVATHDIGAIAFYSGKPVVDMLGLVSPEMIDRIGNNNRMLEFLVNKQVTHIAVLRDWFEIANQAPVFQTNKLTPEILEVFPFEGLRTHFTSQEVSGMIQKAQKSLSQRDMSGAGQILRRAVTLDPQSSRVHFLLAVVHFDAGELENAQKELNATMAIYPSYWDSYLALADIDVQMHHPDSAVAHLQKLITRNPSYAEGYLSLSKVYQSFGIDTARAKQYLRRYQQLKSTEEGREQN